MTLRKVSKVIRAVNTSDGAGVKLRRSLGQSAAARLDPMLMLDEFYSDQPEDYLAGFPSHPHRGFETVTYILDGHMLHEDHLGNRGDLISGGVQWMRAARGMVHSEMPQQTQGRMRGFQLWLNLPAREKMQDPWYRDIQPADIPTFTLAGGGEVKLIAGQLRLDGQPRAGAVTEHLGKPLSTAPLLADLALAASSRLSLPVPATHNLCLYVYEGNVQLAGAELESGQAALMGPGDELEVETATGARLLLIGGKAIGEPVVQYGPFVMNSSEEIEQALRDYRDGHLTATR